MSCATDPTSIPREAEAQRRVRVAGDTDPTATVPRWQFTQDADRPASQDQSTWLAGTWGPWTSTGSSGWAYAVTPTIGGPTSDADVPLAVGRWRVWLAVGGEITEVGYLTIT